MPIRRSPNDARHLLPQAGRDPRNGWSRSIESLVAINRNTWSRSPGARTVHRQGRIPGRGQTDPGASLRR